MQRSIRQTQSWFRRTVAVAVICTLTGCVSEYRNHGYAPSDEDLTEVVVGVDSRDSVIEAIGAPSSSGVLDDSGLYYVSTRVRHYGLRRPQPVEREMVAISFDTRGIVSNVERFGLEDGMVVPLERRVTSSGVSDKTFLRQLMGSLGNLGPGDLLQ